MYLRLWILLGLVHTLFEIFIFVQKFNFDFPRKLPIFLGWKTRENVMVLDFLAVDNFDFTRKIVKNILGEKLVKMLGFSQNWIFGQKFDFSNSVVHSHLMKLIDFERLEGMQLKHQINLTVVEND